MSSCEGDSAATSIWTRSKALYTTLANEPHRDFGWGKGKENARSLGYAPEWLETLPDAVWESAAAVGNPFAVAAIAVGQTVVDLGCGAGADACVAALLVGSSGRVVGVDCTPAMIAKARANAAAAGLGQTEFHESDMTRLPLPTAARTSSSPMVRSIWRRTRCRSWRRRAGWLKPAVGYRSRIW